jgi:hypothetical protein
VPGGVRLVGTGVNCAKCSGGFRATFANVNGQTNVQVAWRARVQPYRRLHFERECLLSLYTCEAVDGGNIDGYFSADLFMCGDTAFSYKPNTVLLMASNKLVDNASR